MMAALVVAWLSVTAVMVKRYPYSCLFKVSQMHCENCERKVKNNIKFEKGSKKNSLNRLEKRKQFPVTYDAEKDN